MMDDSFLRHGMELALQEADLAAQAGEVPAGCIILEMPPDDELCPPPSLARVLGRAHNQTETLNDATAHAERMAISQAAATTGDWRLTRAVLFTTKEPCAMCAGAIVLARIPMVVYGLADPKRGGATVFGILDHPNLIHRATVIPGILEDRCREQLLSFFRACRGRGHGEASETAPEKPRHEPSESQTH